MGNVILEMMSFRTCTNPRSKHLRQYGVVYYFRRAEGEKVLNIQRRLKDSKGNPLVMSEGAYIKKGAIYGEDPQIVAQVASAATLLQSQLKDQGVFSMYSSENGKKNGKNGKGVKTFKGAMDDYKKWRETRRKNPKFETHAKNAIDRFGNEALVNITYDVVEDWIDELAGKYAKNTVNRKTDPPKSMFNWLIKTGKWNLANPFAGHEKPRCQPTERHKKPTISDEEWFYMENNVKSDPLLSQAVHIGYYTGIRPEEVYRVQGNDFDFEDMTMSVRYTKGGRGKRLIAIPEALKVFLVNQGEFYPMAGSTLQHKIQRFRKGRSQFDGFTMETFRINFGIKMEQAGVSEEWINAHQGRYETNTLKENYLKRYPRRAVDLMRKPLAEVFDRLEGKDGLAVVKG